MTFEIGEKYWFNVPPNGDGQMKTTCNGKLCKIHQDENKRNVFTFTNVGIYYEDDIGDYEYYGSCSDKTVFEDDIFNSFFKAIEQAKEDYKYDTNEIQDKIRTLKDLLEFPLSYKFNNERRAVEIYIEKAKEITGIDIKKQE